MHCLEDIVMFVSVICNNLQVIVLLHLFLFLVSIPLFYPNKLGNIALIFPQNYLALFLIFLIFVHFIWLAIHKKVKFSTFSHQQCLYMGFSDLLKLYKHFFLQLLLNYLINISPKLDYILNNNLFTN